MKDVVQEEQRIVHGGLVGRHRSLQRSAGLQRLRAVNNWLTKQRLRPI
jgi:hypothetical protein